MRGRGGGCYDGVAVLVGEVDGQSREFGGELRHGVSIFSSYWEVGLLSLRVVVLNNGFFSFTGVVFLSSSGEEGQNLVKYVDNADMYIHTCNICVRVVRVVYS